MNDEPDRPEVACVGCGYDLRGLDPERPCPECGTPIARSRAGHWLAYADPAWLARVTLGQRLLSIGINITAIGSIFVLTLLIVAGAVAAILDVDWDSRPLELLRTALLVGAVLGGTILASVGTFMVTMPDPRDSARERPWSVRPLARWGMGGAVTVGVVATVVDPLLGMPAVSVAFTLLALATLTVGLVSVLLWQSALAARIPDAGLADSLRDAALFLRWGLPFFVVGGLLKNAVPALSGLSKFVDLVIKSISVAFGCGGMIVFIMLLVHAVGLMVTMNRLSAALRKIAAAPLPAGP